MDNLLIIIPIFLLVGMTIIKIDPMLFTKYYALWRSLDPETFAERIGNRIYMARETFPLKSNTVRDYAELEGIAISFYIHLERQIQGEDLDLPVYLARGRLLALLRVESFEPFYDGCVRGLNNGGLISFLNRILDFYHREQEHQYVSWALSQFIDETTDYEVVYEIMEEYVNLFAKQLPFPTRDIHLLVRDWKEILLNHCRLLSTIRTQIGRI